MSRAGFGLVEAPMLNTLETIGEWIAAIIICGSIVYGILTLIGFFLSERKKKK
jgi:hypothetical protein